MPVLQRTVYVTPKEFMEQYKLSRAMITKLVQQGMPHKYVGNRLRIPSIQADEWIDKRFN